MTAILFALFFALPVFSDDSYRALDGQPEIALERFALPVSVVAENELLTDLATRTGVAGSQLEGLRLRIALPQNFRVESIEIGMVDGVFLVRENSFLAAVGGFLMRLVRLLLFGQLVDAGDGLKIPSTLWFILLDGDPTKDEPISVKTTTALKVDAGDPRLSDHGSFVVCRLVAATSPFTELLGLEIRGRNRVTGERLRYYMPRLAVPPLISRNEGPLPFGAAAVDGWLGAAP